MENGRDEAMLEMAWVILDVTSREPLMMMKMSSSEVVLIE